jgi:hypothetical protein
VEDDLGSGRADCWKRIAKGRRLLVVSLVIWGVSSFATQKQQTFTGEVMDSSCAKMGSHEMMEKQHGMSSSPASDKACTLACVKAGSKLVLYDASTKTVYELDDQKKG